MEQKLTQTKKQSSGIKKKIQLLFKLTGTHTSVKNWLFPLELGCQNFLTFQNLRSQNKFLHGQNLKIWRILL